MARTAIFTKFEEVRAAAATYPTDAEFPIEIRNRRFKQPAAGPWGRLTIQFGNRSPNAIGGGNQNLNRTPFVLVLQIFLPENSGEAEAYLIAEELIGGLDFGSRLTANIVDNVRLNLWFSTTSFNQVGKTSTDESAGSAGFEQFNATASGHFDDYPTA